jgi:hypothetical protein
MSASLEKLFSSAGNYFDPKKNRTKAETLRLVTCLKQWEENKEI